jgi:gliding motility-associated-like protein
MKNVKWVFIVSIFASTFCKSQNLVPNSKFENYNVCVGFLNYPFSGIYYNGLISWYGPNLGSPDYHNVCNTSYNLYFGVPISIEGFQLPKSGNGFCGFCVYYGPSETHEYISVKLKNQLIAGKNYCAKFYVNLTDSSFYASSNIGIYFSDTAIHQNNNMEFPFTPQIENPVGNFITDKINWVEINGSFIANGGEQYITIGNFHSNGSTSIIPQIINCDYCRPISYYFVEDVSVYDCDSIVSADAGNNLQICLKDSITIGNGNHLSDYGYSWLPATGLNDPNIYNPKASPPITTTYYLTQTDFLGTITTDSVIVTVVNCDSNAVAEAGNSQTICKGNAIQIGMPTITGYTYQWQPLIGLSNANISNPVANPNVTTTYYLTSNYQGYYETIDSNTITVINCDTIIPKPNELIVPNAFTPNNDGVNDLFHATGYNIAQIQAKVFNRWGQELYKWDNLNESWNGKYKGNDVASGTYFYVVTVVYDDGSVEEKKGVVTLIR